MKEENNFEVWEVEGRFRIWNRDMKAWQYISDWDGIECDNKGQASIQCQILNQRLI